jgi:hypothetical protein
MKYGKEKEVEIFKALATQSTLKVGLMFGFDKVYKDTRAIRNAVNGIFNKVKNNCEEYGINQEVVDLVQEGMTQRKLAIQSNTPVTLAEANDEKFDIKNVVSGIRDKTFHLIDKKLNRLANSTKKLDAVSFKDLGIIAGISFDKSQILRGEATETITVISQLDKNLPPSEIISLALQAREQNVDKNSGR